MKLTPLDIRKHEFARKMRGYDPDEVKAFTEMVSRQWEEVLDELRHAQDRVRELEGRIGHYEKVEEALHEALETARNGAKRTQEQAEERARLIIEDAELKAEQRLQETDRRRGELRQNVSDLTRRHDEIVARMRHFLMSELEILARHEEERPTGFVQLMPAQRSVQPEPRAGEGVPSPLSEQGEDTDAQREGWMPAEAPEGADNTEGSDVELDADEEPAWTLRSIVGGHDEPEDVDEGPDDEPVGAPDAEKERIRRILEDLD